MNGSISDCFLALPGVKGDYREALRSLAATRDGDDLSCFLLSGFKPADI